MQALSTPLLDFFRRGEVARDIRLLAAQGALAPRAHEQLGLLMLLVGDQDPEVAGAAERTLRAIPRESLALFLGRTDASTEMRTFFAARGIEAVASPVAAADSDEPMVDASPAPEPASAESREDEGTVTQRIARLGVAQRITLAMKGSREERAILIRDGNKIVAAAVLSSPKLTESEIESIARMASVSEDVLRIISNTRSWMKRYGVMAALARNPKTPIAVSMNLLPRLTEKDVRAISADRNVPEVLRITARQKIVLTRK